MILGRSLPLKKDLFEDGARLQFENGSFVKCENLRNSLAYESTKLESLALFFLAHSQE